jgi:hypothetical protein
MDQNKVINYLLKVGMHREKAWAIGPARVMSRSAIRDFSDDG